MEQWKDIPGYEGLYVISNLGEIKSVRRNTIMKPSLLPKGYKQIGLTKDGKRTYSSVHRLVAKTFIDNPNNLPCVNHKDCNPGNNKVENLEWCSILENNNYKNHKLKMNVSIALYRLKKDYPGETKLINKLEEIQDEIKQLN